MYDNMSKEIGNFYEKKGCIIYSLIELEQKKYFNIFLKILDVLKSMYIENTKK